MNRIKKVLSLCLAAVLLLALTACGGNGTSQAGSDSGKAADIGGTVLLDSEDVKVTAVGMEELYDEPMLRFSVENNLDQTVWVDSSLCAVNGFVDDNSYFVRFHTEDEGADYMGSWEVPANSSGDNYGLLFNNNLMELAGITEIGDIELTLYAGKEEFAEDYMGEPVTLHVADVEQSYDEDGTVLLDNDSVKLIAQGIVMDEYMGPEIKLYAIGKGDKSFYLNMDNVFVDGAETFAYYGAEIFPGKRSLSTAAFDGFEEVTEIKELKCSFSAYTDDGEELFATEEVTVTF